MANKGAQGRRFATDSGVRPGRFPVGSAQSRAAARALLVARKESEDDQRFQVVYRADGSVSEMRGLAEVIRAGRLRLDAGEGTASLPIDEGGQYFNGRRQTDCLAERIRRARERVGWDSTR
jgi:hypothetical protein